MLECVLGTRDLEMEAMGHGLGQVEDEEARGAHGCPR